MTDFAQTIENHLGVFGGSLTSKWGDMYWGEPWGERGDIEKSVDKILEDSSTLTTANAFSVGKIIAEDLDLDVTIVTQTDFIQTINVETLTILADMGAEYLIDSEGFYHVFRGNATDAENRVITDYTDITNGGSSWSEIARPSTPWS